MDIGKLRRWIRLRIDTVETSRVACLSQGDIHHQKGRDLQGEQQTAEWEQAERFHASAKDLRDARFQDDTPQPMKNYTDKSVHGNSAPTQQANPTINISERTLSIIAFGLAVLVFGVSTMTVINQSQSESRTRAELERQNRFLQEYRIRVEDAEIAAEEVNPKFHPRRTE